MNELTALLPSFLNIGVLVAAVGSIIVFAIWGRPLLAALGAITELLIRWTLGLCLLASAPAIGLTTPLTSRLGIPTVGRRAVAKLATLPFDRRTVAESTWPPSIYPELYADVPADMERPPFEDGRLVGGRSISSMQDRLFSRELLESAVILGLLAAFALLIVTAAGVVVGGVWPVLVAIGQDVQPLESWGAGMVVAAPATVKLGAVWSTLASSASAASHSLVAYVLLSISVACGLPLVMVSTTINEHGAEWRVQTKDSRTRYRHRAELRNLARRVYRQSVALATGYLKGSPTYDLGSASGMFRLRGDLAAPMHGQAVALDKESLHQHLMVLGGTGEGKTSAILKPIIRQLLTQDKPRYGLFAMDAKGVLWRDLLRIAEQVGRADDVVIVGCETGQVGLDVLAGLEPKDVAAVAKALFDQQSGGGSGDDFWPAMASSIIRHCAELAKAWQQATGERHYTLTEIYRLALDSNVTKTAGNAIGEAVAAGRIPPSNSLRDSVEYMLGAWETMAAVTKSGIIANVSQLLDPLAGSDALRKAFCEGEAGTDIKTAFDGKIVLFALSSLEHGLGARLVLMLAKTAFYRAARLREMKIGAQAAQAAPVIVAMDEAQELLTADASGMSDGTFWNVARSSGVAGIVGTQTVAALQQVLGEDATANIVQQFRSKVVLRTEDPATHELCVNLAGEQLRSFAYEEHQRESLEARAILDGFDVLRGTDGDIEAVALAVANCQRGVLSMCRMAWKYIGGTTSLNYANTADYSVDRRFMQSTSARAGINAGIFGGVDDAELGRQMAAVWRAEDQDRKYLSEGNETKPTLAVSDLITMGRWNAFAHIQRAGAARQDIIEVTHDFN